MTLSYNLRILDQLDGLSTSTPVAPRWKTTNGLKPRGSIKANSATTRTWLRTALTGTKRTTIGQPSMTWPASSAVLTARMRLLVEHHAGQRIRSRS